MLLLLRFDIGLILLLFQNIPNNRNVHLIVSFSILYPNLIFFYLFHLSRLPHLAEPILILIPDSTLRGPCLTFEKFLLILIACSRFP